MSRTPAKNSSSRSICPIVAQAREMVERLGDSVGFYKIGMELAYGGGLSLWSTNCPGRASRSFVDLKLHDIGHTVEKATAQIARLGVRFLTVHAFPQTLAAARRGAEGSTPAGARRDRDDLL